MNARKIRLRPGNDSTCPRCGSEAIASRSYSDTVDFRGLELDVEGLQETKCSHCAYVWKSEAQDAHNGSLIRSVYAEVRDRLRAAHGLLSGYEIARIRESLGLNQREAAALFGGGYNAFNKYESGEVLQSLAMDRLLRLAKAIGFPAVTFLRDANAPVPFVVIPLSTTGTVATVSVPRDETHVVTPRVAQMIASGYGTRSASQNRHVSLTSSNNLIQECAR